MQHHCFDIQGAGFFQTPGVFIDSPGIFCYFVTLGALKYDIWELTYAMKYLAGKVGMEFDYLMRSLNKTFDWNKALSDAIGTQETMQSVRHYPIFSTTNIGVFDWLFDINAVLPCSIT